MIKELNFLEVYVYQKWNSQTLPEFAVGQMLVPEKLEMAGNFFNRYNFLKKYRLSPFFKNFSVYSFFSL